MAKGNFSFLEGKSKGNFSSSEGKSFMNPVMQNEKFLAKLISV